MALRLLHLYSPYFMKPPPPAPEHYSDEATIAARRPDSTPVTDPRLPASPRRQLPLTAQPPSGPVPDRTKSIDEYNPVG